MPFLRYRQYKIDFTEIRPEIFNSIPEELKSAAGLIWQWYTGNETFLMQTSGSTGAPKTISLLKDKIIHSAGLSQAAFNLQKGDSLFCCLGLHYVAGFMMLMRAMVLDANLIIEEPSSNPLVAYDINDQIDFASFIPLQMETMLNDANAIEIMNGMKAILLGGAPVSDSLREKLQVLQVPVYHTYSMTETYTHVAIKLLNTEKQTDFFQALPGVSLVLDDRGCLIINSYITDYKDLVTNDLAEITGDGTFKWLGRYDNIINSGGIKISIEKTENTIAGVFSDLGLKNRFFAAGTPDEKLGQKLVMVIEGDLNTVLVKEQLANVFFKYEQPKGIYLVDKIEMTHTGKIDRSKTLKKLKII